MSDVDNSEFGLDSTEHQTSYIFTPSTAPPRGQQHSAKHRKKSLNTASHNVASFESCTQFPALLNGQESQRCVELRKQLYLQAWKDVELEIEDIISHANQYTLEAVATFVNQPRPLGQEGKIPTGLIVTGPNIASQQLLFSQITERLQVDTLDVVVIIRSGDAINLKAALKKIIRDATNQTFDDEDDEDDGFQEHQHTSMDRDERGRKLLSYDLELLHKFVKAKGCNKVVIAFQDSEGFDVSVLSQLIQLISAWQTRIPTVVLFGIATSVELFHERLPRKTIRLLFGEQFGVEATSTTLQTIFRRVVAQDSAKLWFGHDFMQALLNRQEEYVQSLQTFVMSLKYAYMCHFYANPLSVFSVSDKDFATLVEILQPEHYEAIRMLESFQTLVLNLLKADDIELAQELLTSDDRLLVILRQVLHSRNSSISRPMDSGDEETISQSKRSIAADICRLDCLMDILQMLPQTNTCYTELFLQLQTDAVDDSTIITHVTDKIKYLNSTELCRVVDSVQFGIQTRAKDYQCDARLLTSLNRFSKILSSDFGDASKSSYTLDKQQSKGLRTTIVAQRVHLSQQAASIEEADASDAEMYTKIVDEVISALQEYFTFTPPKDVPFHELFIFNSRSPNHQVFTPKPRQAVEQALSTPHSYLDCECCHPWQDSLASTNPPTAILYKLYLETGGLINVFDLWSAFYTIVGGEDGTDCSEKMSFMLFYRALAELKLMGMLKQSRKKVDHLAKTTWMGL